MTLRELSLKKFYDSDVDNILDDFYIPVLARAIKYQRLAGFFSSTSLAVAAKGIIGLIQNAGKMELICSARLSEQDVKSIVDARESVADVVSSYSLREFDELEKLENEFVINHVKALGWMVANNLLEIKIAVLKDSETRPLDYRKVLQHGMFHQKVGILYDREGDIVSFSGSDNESASGWIGNIEEFKVFFSWDESTYGYVRADCGKFQKFWSNAASRTEIIDVPDAVKKKLIEITPRHIEELERKLKSGYSGQREKKRKEVVLWDHQKQAVEKWLNNGKQCIFEMATGTGKTFAALFAVKKLFEEEKRIVVVVACPYNHLITQWHDDVDECRLDIDIIIADSSNPKWKHQLSDYVSDINNDVKDKVLVFTTHDTFSRPDFISIIRNIKTKIFLIGDEVHGMWAEKRKAGFIEKYDYRLGLSATPSRWFDPEGTKDLFVYFGIKDEKDMYQFSLSQAIKTINPATGKTYLTPYDYFPYFVELSSEEMDKYISESKKIARLYHSSKSNKERYELFNLMCIKRQEIVRNAELKFVALEQILNAIPALEHCFIYCSPEQIDRVQDILNSKHIIQHKFTESEGTLPQERYGNKSERDHLLDQFARGVFQILVAIRCLDEGVDIPQAKIGIILASTGNPRQYIQRRGRLLRQYPGKDKAQIYDLLVFPSLNNKMPSEFLEIERKIMSREIVRYEEFAKSALNMLDCLKILHERNEKLEK